MIVGVGRRYSLVSGAMRTIRELAGWALLFIAVLMPFVGLGFVVVAIADEGPWPALLGIALLLGLAWPRVLLSSARLRDPVPEEIVEADGRAPVLVLHRFARTEPLITRLLFGQPTLFRELRDAWDERTIARRYALVGPIEPLTRPSPPPPFGPVRPAIDVTWATALERALRRCRLAVIVLDGSEANVHELERARVVLGLDRVVLVMPPRLADADYARLQARLSWLPTSPDPFVRFDHEGRAFGFAEPYVHDAERTPMPVAPSSARLVALLPLPVAFLAAFAVPAALEDGPLALYGDDGAGWGVLTVVLGGVLAWLGHRAARLVPSNEAVMVLVAALPWLLPGLVLLLESHPSDVQDVRRLLEQSALGAAYAAPLLWATAVVLAVTSLARRTEDRRPAFALFGASVVLPLAPVAQTFFDVGQATTHLTFGLALGALALGLATWAASGEPKRAHAPLPIGAAVAASACVAASLVIVEHGASYELLARVSQGGDVPDDVLAALAASQRIVPWLMLLAPSLVVLIGVQFRGRGSRVAIGSLAAFVPLAVLAVVASSAGARARAMVEAPYLITGSDPFAPVRGAELAAGFELPRVGYASAVSTRAELVLDHTGVYAEGARVVDTRALALPGGSPPALMRALLASQADDVRVTARQDLDASMLLSVASAARRAGRRRIALIARDPAGSLTELPLTVAPETPTSLTVQVFHHELVLTDRWGSQRVIAHVGGRPDEATFRQALAERRQFQPSEHEMSVAPRFGAQVSDVALVAFVAQGTFGEVRLASR